MKGKSIHSYILDGRTESLAKRICVLPLLLFMLCLLLYHWIIKDVTINCDVLDWGD